nr:sigma-70 family RNA polymerase sigma factor [uncultured Mucilaginibacter sp.]
MQTVPGDKFINHINENIGIIHKICNIYFTDADDRKDAYQEILYQLWRSYASFKGDAKFSTWMYKVALNTAITYHRKSNRQHNTNMLAEDLEQFAGSDEQQHVNERMALLYAAINTLNATDKAISLLYLEDNSYDEIAAITGLSKTNVSVRLVRVKLKLKEKLKNII